MIARILLVAGNTMRAILDKRAIYIWGAAVLLVLLRAAPALFFEGDDTLRTVFRAQAVAGALQAWAVLCVATAIFIGAGAVSSEIEAKTLITVLARPIARWETLTGKWLGLTAFGLVTTAMGAIVGMAVAGYFGIELDRRAFMLALAHTSMAIALFGGLAVAISANSTSGLAGLVAALMVFMSVLVGMLESDTPSPSRTIGRALGAVTPVGFIDLYSRVPRLSADTLRRTPAHRQAHAEYDARAQPGLFAENAAFTVIFLVAGGVLFSRRDIKL